MPTRTAWRSRRARHGGVDVAAAVADGDWVFMSDVCKHCTNAGCLDACPTGALIRTEFETVVLQPDVCNGCGYCVPACPFGVVDRDHIDGRAAKCTLCYDRLEDGLEPACAKACPTDSIQFGPYDELVEIAERRVATLHGRGVDGAYLYGAGDEEGEELAGGLGAFFLLTQPPERYGLPAHADSPIQENVVPATIAATAAGLLAAAGAAAGVRAGREEGEPGPAHAREEPLVSRCDPQSGRRRASRQTLARWRGSLEKAAGPPAVDPSTRRRRPPKGASANGWPITTPHARHDARRGHARRPRVVAARGGGRRRGAGAARLRRRALVVPVQAPRHGLRGHRPGARRGGGGEPADALRCRAGAPGAR